MKEISSVCVFGDSLSDSGNMKNSHIFGVITIPGTGLDKSGDGRFADRLCWPGYLTLWRMKQAFADQTQTIDIDKKIFKFFDDEVIKNGSNNEVLGNPISRNYAVGGATSAPYHILATLANKAIDALKFPLMFLNSLRHIDRILTTIAAIGSQAVVTNLEEERREFLAEHANDTDEDKQSTLIIEWSGANDLITVNTVPTKGEAYRAVKARLLHLEKLYEQGYRNFILFNLPDVSLVPRYQRENPLFRSKVNEVVNYFNHELMKGISDFRSKHGDCDPLVFDAYKEFNEIYFHAERYGFSKDFLAHNLCDDKASQSQSGITPEDTKYMFWNEVHPVSKVQKELADKLIVEIQKRFSFTQHDKLLAKQVENLKSLPTQYLNALMKLEDRIADLGTELSARNFTTQTKRKFNKIKGLNYIINKICYSHKQGEINSFSLIDTIRTAKFLFPDLTRGCSFFSVYKSRTEKLLCELSEQYNEEVVSRPRLFCCT